MVEESSHGTKRLATDVLYRMQIPKPSIEKQEDALRILDSSHARLDESTKHISVSRNVRQALLNDLIGNHRV